MGCWNKVLSSLPLVPLHRATPNWLLASHKAREETEREKNQDGSLGLFITQSWKWHPNTCYILSYLNTDWYSKEEIIPRSVIGGRNNWGPPKTAKCKPHATTQCFCKSPKKYVTERAFIHVTAIYTYEYTYCNIIQRGPIKPLQHILFSFHEQWVKVFSFMKGSKLSSLHISKDFSNIWFKGKKWLIFFTTWIAIDNSLQSLKS